MNIFLSASFRTGKEQRYLKRIKKILKSEGNVIWNAMDHIGDYYGTLQQKRLNEIIEIEKDQILKSDLVIIVICSFTPEPIMQLLYAAEYEIPVIIFLNLENEDKSLSLSPWIYGHGQVVKSEQAFLNAIEKINKKIENKYK